MKSHGVIVLLSKLTKRLLQLLIGIDAHKLSVLVLVAQWLLVNLRFILMKQSSDLGFKLCERDARGIIEREATHLATVTRTVGDFYGHHCTPENKLDKCTRVNSGQGNQICSRTVVGVDEHIL